MSARLAAAIALACAACDAHPDLARDTAEVVGGVADVDHPEVVAIVGRRATCASADRVVCSGTLIAPRVVLTAAHCLDGVQAHELEVIAGDDVGLPQQIFAVWEAYVHPGYDANGAPETSLDLALLLIETPAAAAPATLPEASLAELTPGAEVTVIGFGRTGADQPSGRRLASTATIETVVPLAVITGDTGVPCGGDSGGAVFVNTPAGERLAAVIKGSGTECTTTGVSLRVEAVIADFIAPTLLAAGDPEASGRPAFDAAAPLCAQPCAAHTECPLGMLCLPERDGMYCGYREGRVSGYGERCDAADGASCIAVGQGSERACRARVACDDDTGGGFCSAGGGDPGAWVLLGLFALGASLRGRRRPSAR